MATIIRLPAPQEIDSLLDGLGKRSEMAERKLKTAINNAWASMSAENRRRLLADLTLSEADLKALLGPPPVDARGRAQLKKVVAGMQALDASGLTRYPPVGPDTRALVGDEETNIRALADAVARTMREVSDGRHDGYVTNVFGAGHEDDAKKVFKGAAEALDRLKPGRFLSGSIVVDVMRKSDVWCCGGLTSSTQMALAESAVRGASDTARTSSAFLTMAHESTHALPVGATTDVLYEHHEGFLRAGAQAKLRTADCYKEVVRQIATGVGRVFVPGDVDPRLGETRSNDLRAAAAEADKVLSGAWITAIRIHDTLHAMAREPGRFVGYETWLRHASILIGATVHREATLKFERNVFSANTGPKITSGDLAVVDNKIAMLAQCNGKAKHVMVEPDPGLSAEDKVRHVLRHVVTSYGSGLKFSKSIHKDVIVIRSLGELHESVNAGQKNLLVDSTGKNAGLAELPEPMKSYRLGI
jgi:hypothetical protein